VASKLDLGDLGQAVAPVNLAPEGTGTRVSWQFDAALRNIIERWFGLLFDRMIGPDFERGLANLKVYIETQP
jgi:carbon monoxide dehydrogenase subunit G